MSLVINCYKSFSLTLSIALMFTVDPHWDRLLFIEIRDLFKTKKSIIAKNPTFALQK